MLMSNDIKVFLVSFSNSNSSLKANSWKKNRIDSLIVSLFKEEEVEKKTRENLT